MGVVLEEVARAPLPNPRDSPQQQEEFTLRLLLVPSRTSAPCQQSPCPQSMLRRVLSTIARSFPLSEILVWPLFSDSVCQLISTHVRKKFASNVQVSELLSDTPPGKLGKQVTSLVGSLVSRIAWGPPR